ncbi:hypothetical protein [uncultured Roseobacter sp.]|uniref:hypothetical protein n=1 Tax=uncultured Roseobacter sp. TaxID=114847 RepID=UPI00260FCD9C|nr:hypothetical protein [uncultured Roseobacter sp.]
MRDLRAARRKSKRDINPVFSRGEIQRSTRVDEPDDNGHCRTKTLARFAGLFEG